MWFGGWERQFTRASLMRLLKSFGFKPIRFYGGWSRPGIFYKIIRELFKKIKICLPMYPMSLSMVTERFYRLQEHLRKKKIFLYTVLSIGVIARKN
jgi:hypothetical protein